jgi:hypothetical protein
MVKDRLPGFLVNCSQSLDLEVPEDPRSLQRITITEISNTRQINKIV